MTLIYFRTTGWFIFYIEAYTCVIGFIFIMLGVSLDIKFIVIDSDYKV